MCIICGRQNAPVCLAMWIQEKPVRRIVPYPLCLDCCHGQKSFAQCADAAEVILSKLNFARSVSVNKAPTFECC
jgi:hypothetical protein